MSKNNDSKTDEIPISPMMDVIRPTLNLPERVWFFDTTLRDGEQTPGIDFRPDEKIAIAQALNDLGVDVIEAGFPVTSVGNFRSCKAISKLGLNSEIIGLARLHPKDIDKVIEADMNGIHLLIATSELHMREKLNMTREQVLDKIQEMVTYAKQHFTEVEFSGEDPNPIGFRFLNPSKSDLQLIVAPPELISRIQSEQLPRKHSDIL